MAYLNFVKPIALDDIVKKHKRTIQYYTLWLSLYDMLLNAIKGYEGKVINKRLKTFLESAFFGRDLYVYLNPRTGFRSVTWEIKIEMKHTHADYEALNHEFYFCVDISKQNDRFTMAEFQELTKQQKETNAESLKRNQSLRMDEIATGVEEWNETMENLKKINSTFQGTGLEYEFDLSRYK